MKAVAAVAHIMEGIMKQKRRKQSYHLLIIAGIALFFLYLGDRVNSYNATLLAFSYKYGFIPRGLIGTIYQGLGDILPVNMQCYAAVNVFVLITTGIYVAVVLLFLGFVRKKAFVSPESCEKHDESVFYLMLFFLIYAIPTFAGYYNLGRVDMYLVLISLGAVVLLVTEKMEWMLVPLSILGVLIHEGYVFMYFNVILVLLIYKYLIKRKKKYLVILLLSLIGASALFLFFTFDSSQGGQDAFRQIMATANDMSYKNKGHVDVVRAEILGVDLTAEEREYHLQNFVEMPIFLLLFAPFIAIAVRFFRLLLQAAKDKGEKLKYMILAAGALTTVPLFIMKVDYGRWCFAVLAYYCITFMTMFAMGDAKALDCWKKTLQYYNQKYRYAKLLIAYALLFTPFTDLSIDNLTKIIYEYPQKIVKMIQW